MSAKGNPIRGSLLLTAGRLVSSFTGLALVWLIAHRGAGDLGVFRTLFSFFLITELFPLLGLQIYLMREVSLHRGEVKKYLIHSAAFALGISVIVAAVLLCVAHWGGYSESVSKGLLIIMAAMPATALYVCCVPILIGLEQSSTLGALQAVETLGRAALGALLVYLGFNILAIIGALVVVRWLVLLVYWRVIPLSKDSSAGHFDWSFFRQILSHVPVFAGITIFAAITRFAAPLMLPWILNDRSAGQFGAAYIIVDVALLLPTAIIANLMPRFSALAKNSSTEISRAANEGVKLMALGTLPVAALTTLFARPILALVFHNPDVYIAATPLLQVSIWLCFLMSVDQVLSSTIVACGKQAYDLQTVAIGAIATLGLLFTCIRTFGLLGGAIGLLAGCFIQVLARFILFAPHIPGLNPLAAIWRPLCGMLGMIAAVYWIPVNYWPLSAFGGLVVYSLILFALGALRAEECDGIFMLLSSRKT